MSNKDLMSGAYYSENDPFAAAWLRELIKAKLIADGEVDDRSIEDVEPGDLRGFTQCHFFAGIGVWSYALRNAGWADSRPVWTGSCPCPSFSAAGKGEGFEDARHLWPHWFRLIRERRPSVVFGEQVESAIGFGWLDLVQTDMEAETYSVGKVVLGACGVGAPHRRQRLYFVADAQSGNRRREQSERSERRERARLARNGIALVSTDTGCPSGLAEQQHESGERPRWSPSPADDAGVGARRESGVSPNAKHNGHDPAGRVETIPDRYQQGLGLFDGNGGAFDGGDTSRRGLGITGGASGESGRTAQSGEVSDREHPNSTRPFEGQLASEAARHRGSVEPASGALDSFNSFQSRLEGHGGNVRKWRGPGWLDPLTARSASEAGATRGFWADCDWWYGRDGKYRPIGAGLFPLAHGAPARVGRLRGYGNAVNAEVAETFIQAYMSVGNHIP